MITLNDRCRYKCDAENSKEKSFFHIIVNTLSYNILWLLTYIVKSRDAKILFKNEFINIQQGKLPKGQVYSYTFTLEYCLVHTFQFSVLPFQFAYTNII